jgi:hypothetical protein
MMTAQPERQLWSQLNHPTDEHEEEIKFVYSRVSIRNRGNGHLIYEPNESTTLDETVSM